MSTHYFEQTQTLDMILKNGDNQNKKAWESRMLCTMKVYYHALQHEAFLLSPLL